MSNQRIKLTLAMAAALLAGHSASQASATGSAEGAAVATELPDGFEVLERHVEAIGGEAGHKKLKGVRMTGSFKMPAMQIDGSIVINAKAPESTVVQVDLGGMGSVVQGTNGKVVWANQPGAQPQIIDGEQAEQIKHNAKFHATVEPRKTYTSAETVSIVEHDDTKCYKVNLVTSWDEHQVALYEVESGLLRKLSVRTSPDSSVYSNETEYGGYKEVGGILHAHTLEMNNGGMQQSMVFDTIEVDPEFEAGLFDPPGAL